MTVLLFNDLGRSLFVLVRLHNFILQLFELGGGRANASDLFIASIICDLEVGHFSSKIVLDSGGWVEVCGAEGGGCHNGLNLNY